MELGGSAGRGPATAMGGIFTIRETAKLLDLKLECLTLRRGSRHMSKHTI
jgi:glutamate dehydrogenase/leucine dehydrogenase